MRTISLSMILTLLTSLSSYGQTCQEVLNNCDTAYNDQKILIKDQNEQIQNYFKKDQLSHQIMDDQQKRLDSPFRSAPTMIAVGAVGVVILEVLTGVFKK